MKPRNIVLSLLVGVAFSQLAYSQDTNVATQPVSLQVAGSALLAVAGPPVVLKLAGALEAGDSVSTEAENDATRLRISSLIKGSDLRTITAKISESLVGTQLSVELGEPNSNFRFQKGQPLGVKVLSNDADAILVNDVGTCWSGRGDDDGYVIKYNFKALPGAPILKGADVIVTFTLSLLPTELTNE